MKDWVEEEAEYQIQASKIKNGISLDGEKERIKDIDHFSAKKAVRKSVIHVLACGGSHSIWKCDTFRSQNNDDKWKLVKRTGLCYRCLGKDHLGSSCPRSRQCNINGYKETNNRLLHGQRRVNVKGPIQDGNLARKPPIKQMESEEKNL